MKAKALVLALLLTGLTLYSERPASASFTCPQYDCWSVTQDCVDSGGAPIPSGTSMTCTAPPWGDEYHVNFVECRYSGGVGNYTLACYQ